MPMSPSLRTVMSSAVMATASAMAPALNVDACIQGIVFLDRSGQGAKAAGNPGIGGVLVSNGREVVATDSEGRWLLPWRPGHGIFVVKPQGWSFTRDLPGLHQGWLPDVGPDNVVLVGLVPTPEPMIFDAALLADTQPQSDLELDYLRDTILDDVARCGAAFAINHGDVVFDDLSLYNRYLRLIAGTGMSWHHCPGNHDMNGAEGPGADRFAVWKKQIGPTHYAFDYGRCTFILLNNVAPLSRGELTSTGYDYCGLIGAEQLAFVRNLLARTPLDRLIVISMHIPLVGVESPDDPAGHTADRDALLSLLAHRPHAVSFAGHTHTTEHHYLALRHGGHHHHHVLTAASGSWWSGPFDHRGRPIACSRDGNPRGFHLLSVEGTRYTTRFIANTESKAQLGHFALCSGVSGDGTLLSDGRMVAERGQLGAARLTFNLYDGGPRSTVRLDLTRRSPSQRVISVAMNRTAMRCPSTVHHFDRNRPVLKSWVEACSSTHVWSAPLPASLPAGVYTATASVRDEYGRERASSSLLEILN